MKKNLKEHHEETFGKDESYDTFVNGIKSMAEGIMQLSLQAVQIYTSIVNRIISDTSATQHEIEERECQYIICSSYGKRAHAS